MTKKTVHILSFVLFFNINSFEANSWGFFAHKKINYYAIFSLPKELLKFYKFHAEYIVENSVKPDKRRYIVEGEACKHFIDIEYYGETPFISLPKKWGPAIDKYSEIKLKEHGILPWNIEKLKYKLTEAFKKLDLEKILSISADMGHYIADANVPLHTTKNYDGQFSNQKGIHAFWESRIPEIFFEKFDLLVGKAEYIDNTVETIWEAIKEAHELVEDLLNKDKELTKQFSSTNKFCYEQKNKITKKEISYAYSKEYNLKLKNQIEQQLRKSIKMVSSFWFTCWVNAGKPDLSKLVLKHVNTENEEFKDEDQINTKVRTCK